MIHMAKRLDAMVIFEVEQYGFDKEQVSKHLAGIHQQYEKLRQENERLKKRVHALKVKCRTIR